MNGNFIDFKPMQGMFRNGVSLCGDIDGKNDFSAQGKYRAPDSMPFAQSYEAGGIASFEYDITTPHGGFFEFFLCDVTRTGDLTRSNFQNGECYALRRASNPICDSGTDSRCGPVDSDYPTRWYHPCRVSSARDQDFIVGGNQGTMLYEIPDVAMGKAVIHAYWQSSNNCNPDGLKEYFQSGAWSAVGNCQGDGGTVGGFRADHTGTCTTQGGKFPEEFFNCADVQIAGGGGGGSDGGGNAGDSGSSGENSGNASSSENGGNTSNGSSGDNRGNVSSGSNGDNGSGGDGRSEGNSDSRGSSDGGGGNATNGGDSGRSNSAFQDGNHSNMGSVSVEQGDEKSDAGETTELQLEPNGNVDKKDGMDHGNSDQSDAGFRLRPGCMPQFEQNRKNNHGYLAYWRQLQRYCAE